MNTQTINFTSHFIGMILSHNTYKQLIHIQERNPKKVDVQQSKKNIKAVNIATY